MATDLEARVRPPGERDDGHDGRRVARRHPAVLVAVAASLAPGAARAQAAAAASSSVRFAWVRGAGAETCADGDAVARAVTDRLGRAPFDASAARSVEGVVAREGQRWVARLYVREPDGRLAGTREIASEAARCDALGNAASLAIALVIDPEAALRPRAPQPPVDPAPVDPPRPVVVPVPAPRPAEPRPAPSPDPPRPARGVVATGRATLLVGVLPAPALGFGVGADVQLAGRLRATAHALVVPDVRAAAPDTWFAAGLGVAALGACVDVARGPAGSLAACGGVWAGVVRAVVFDRQPTQPGDRAWVAGSLGARAHVRVAGPLALELGLAAVAPFTRYRFFVEGTERTLFEQPFVALAAHAGLAVTIP